MAELAVKRNSSLVRARRVEIVMASAASLPFDDAAFDRALCVHVLYFWSDLDRPFAEIARVLKPGGKLALLFQHKRRRESHASLPGRGLSLFLADRGVAPLEEVGLAIEQRDELAATPPHCSSRRSARKLRPSCMNVSGWDNASFPYLPSSATRPYNCGRRVTVRSHNSASQSLSYFHQHCTPAQ